MFAPATAAKLHGPDLDSPINCFLMDFGLHQYFGELTMWFESTVDYNPCRMMMLLR